MPAKKIPLVFVFTLAIAAALFGATVRHLQNAETAASSEVRPEFSLPDLKNEPRSIQDWDGKLVLVNFWASWCPPCVKEMPLLDQLRRENLHRDFEIIGITAEPLQDATKYLSENPVSYPILNGESNVTMLGQRFGNEIGSIPFSVLIDKNGIIQRRYHGEINLEALQTDINDFS